MSKSALKKILCAILTIAMVFSTIPFSICVSAATVEHPDAVTITVTDESGNPVEGATVSFVVDSVTNGDEYIKENKVTDEYGTVDVFAKEQFVEDDLKLTATVTKTGYKEQIVETVDITSEDQDFGVTLISTTISDVTIEGVTVKYVNGINEPAVRVSGKKAGDTVTYKLNDGEFSENVPNMDDLGTYVVTVRVERDGFNTLEKTVTSVVEYNVIEESSLGVSIYSGTYDGESHPVLTKPLNILEGDTVTYKLNDEPVQNSIPEVTNAGIHYLTIIIDRYGYKLDNNLDYYTYQVKIDAAPFGECYKAVPYGGIYGAIYDGKYHDIVDITCEKPHSSDRIRYKLGDGEWTETMPQVKDAGTYEAFVEVTRNDSNYEGVAKVDVTPATINITPAIQRLEFKSDDYNAGEKTTVVFDEDNMQNNIYDFSASGDEIQIENDIVYSVHNAVDGGKDVNAIAEIDSNGILMVKGPGCVIIKAYRAGNNNYKEVYIEYNLIIKADSDGLLYFDNANTEYTFGSFVDDEDVPVIPSQTAIVRYANKGSEDHKNDVDNGIVSYSIVGADTHNYGLNCDPNSGEITIISYSELYDAIDSGDGKLILEIKAEKTAGTATNNNVKSTDTIDVYFSNNPYWDNVNIHYWGSKKTGDTTWPGVSMTNTEVKNDYGETIYKCTIPSDVVGVVFNNGSGSQTQNVYNVSETPFDNNSGFYIRKENDNLSTNADGHYVVDRYSYSGSATDNEKQENNTNQETIYDTATASYYLVITTELIPAETYKLSGALSESGWYTSAVTAVAADSDNYYISKTVLPESFADSTEYSEQGILNETVYLRNKTTGGITAKIQIENLKIDTIAPDENNMSIEFSELTWIEKFAKLFGFGNPDVTVTFRVDDEIGAEESGVDYINWYYTKENETILAESGKLEATRDENGYVAQLTLTASEAEQYRGNISFTATDIAGNTSELVTEESVIVLDTINPVMYAEAEFGLADANGKYTQSIDGKHHYYNGNVDFKFTIEESNFFSEDVAITVEHDNEEYAPVVNWTTASEDEVHIGQFTLEEDGDYYVHLKYSDNSGNVLVDNNGSTIDEYISDLITIDTESTTLKCDFDKEKQIVTFTVNERNFDPASITVTGTINDIQGNSIALTAEAITRALKYAGWSSNSSGVHTLVYDFSNGDSFYDGIYDLTISYEDYSGEITVIEPEPETFIVDHTDPYGIKIEYAKSPLDTFLETITLGFFNPSVTVRFTAYDNTSGVDKFVWMYTREEYASDINRETDVEWSEIIAEASGENSNKFTATFTLPDSEAKQLRGYLSVYAVDNYGNACDGYTDSDNVFVVDTIAPGVTVTYNEESRRVGDTTYYNGDVKVTVRVEDANYNETDLDIKVTRNGELVDNNLLDMTWWVTSEEDDVCYTDFTLSDDGHYFIYVKCEDGAGNFDENVSEYESHEIIIDTTVPVIDVVYSNLQPVNTLTDNEKHERMYFDDTQVATVTITEHNFNESEVDFSQIIATDVADMSFLNDDSVEFSEWTHNGDVHTITITYNGDRNYTFDVDYTDLATNAAADYAPDYFTVDKTAPTNLTVSYSTSLLDTVLESVTFGFYNAKMTVTITADDDTSIINQFVYSYKNSIGVSSVNAELINQAISEAEITYSENNQTATAKFEIPKYVLQNDNQFNGTVAFTATDRAGNSTDLKDTRRVVVDNITPICDVTFNQPINEVNGISYYAGNIEATVKITEANFYSEDVVVSVTRNGASYPVTPRWTNESVDVHIGTFTLTEDADYVITVNYTDKSGNRMTAFESNQKTIDTSINAPTFSINGVAKSEEGGAYKGDATVAFSYEDQNFASKTIRLTRTRFDSVEDVTAEFVTAFDNDKGGSGSFDIPKTVENDGIYELTIGITDKANHSTQSSMKFTINRYGSVYEYNDYLASLIKDGGQYITIADGNAAAINEDLIITEYNADRILKDSLKILVTRDGEAIDVDYSTSPSKIDDQVAISNGGWYKYVYTIKASNFAQDGVYKISLTSAYAASDSETNDSTSVPENSIAANGEKILDTMSFTVDTKAPEIRNIVNLESAIVNAQTLDVKYTIVDVGGLKSIEIILNGKTIETITEFGDSVFNYSGQFTINESNDAQTVRFRITDLAGNVTDTDAENFTTGELYIFNDVVTVSTNFFVRFYANKLLFWGSIGGVVALAAAIFLIIAAKRKKKES